MSLALGVLVHANHARRGGRRVGQRGDKPQQGPADRRPEGVHHPGAGPARERKTHRDQSRPQSLGPSPEPAGEPGNLLGEGLARARVLLAHEPAHPYRRHGELADRWRTTGESQVGAVYSARSVPASWAGRLPDGRPGLDPDDRVGHLDRLQGHALHGGNQQLVHLRPYFVRGAALWTTPHSGRAVSVDLNLHHTKIDSHPAYAG